MIGRTRISKLMHGYRGRPPVDMDGVVTVLERVAELAIEHPEIRELDINPLLADHEGVIAVDARIRVGAAKAGQSRVAISPYPKELESRGTLRDGTAVRFRPIRPEDEPLLQDVAEHMDPEDLRLRFFTPMKGLTHQLAARLSQIDYDREMALIALTEDDKTALGVVRYAADPDLRRAEYAIALRSDWKGKGLGYMMMNRLVEVARERGIGEITGEVLRENEPMLQMCRELGFALAVHPQEPELVHVKKPLGEANASAA
jgi:acetyltransferase